ncbi:ankyrin repeat domain-containing protein 26 isoform X7 [Electrophorus electricus]|uniref:ankyrin repeat domain-containing protein 26 isoform X7 n=1 Tax=Electrophorus electricus TaxID=8005 RepID=UPI0015D0A462|nr:ankyrin repeat domain-containing protein 26 isoform X7 [Electrophorus electricus]
MKKIFNFTKKKKSSPSASDTGSVLSVGYDLKEKDLGKVHKAAFAGDVAKLKQLTKKNDLNQLDKENRTPLHIACVQGHTEVVQFLVENKVKLNLCDNQNRSALMKAVQCQQDRCVSVILDHEADPNLVDINGNTALHLAARIPSLSVALQLLEHEANINAQNKEGNTPLILSVEENHAEMAERLLKEGADVNIKNQERRSALMIAACNGQISMVRLLLQYDADITVKDDKGWSSDDYAVMNGHHACSHLIIEHGTKRKSFQSASHLTVLGSPEAGLSLRGPAPDKDAAGRSFREAGKVTEDNSRADSISRASKSGPADSWPSTDEDDELDLSPKKAQKVNLKKLMSASKKERKDVGVDRDPDKSWSGTESEPNSEGSAVDHPAFTTALHASSTSTQHPATSIPNSFSNLPQKTTPLISSQKEKVSSEDEENEVKDEYDETEGESSEGSDLDEEVEHHQKTETSQDKPRDFMSELGIEKDSEEDSPWDSESGSDSPKKKQQSESKSPTKSHKAISSVCEESNEDLLYIPSFLRGSKHNSVFRTVGWPGGHKAVVLRTSHEKEDDSKAEKPEKQHKPMLRGQSSVLSKMMHSEDAEKKTDLMEEFGLGDVDDLEDASDWDTASTTSRASKALPVYKPEEELADEGPLVLPVVQEQNLDASSTEDQSTDSPKRTELLPRVTLPLPSPRTLTPRISTQLQPQLQPHTSRNLDRPGREEVTPADDGASDSSFEANEHPDKDVVAKTDVMKGEHKTTALWDTGGSSKQTEVQQGKGKKADTSPGKANPQQDSGSHQRDGGFERSDSLSPRWHTKSQKSTNRTTEEDDVSQRSLRHVPALQQARPPCPVKHQNGDPLSVFDDSTLSEVSEDEGRSPSSRHRKEKSGGELDVADNFEDLTQSSDTATEELDSAMSGFRHAALLIKQLDTSSIDSVSMVKLQNMFHEYERTIQRERGRHSRLSDKVSQLEQERSELRLLLDETRKSKSSLEHLRLELETDLNNFKFLLKQEQEKHQSASMLYDKTREQLRRKEEQCRAEAEERQKVELGMRSLELEMRALLNNLKQLEEDRREAQRLLAHERTGRALQEELLNSHLRRQQDIEEQNLRSLNKSNEVMSQLTEASDRERELQHQLRTLQEELSSARAELECSRSQWQQDEARLAEDKEALRERLEDARRDLKLNEEALAQTVFQYNGQLSALKAECSVVSAKLEHERQTRQQLEAEAEAGRARLQAALQETERCQAARADAERTLQRERDEHQRAQQKWAADASTHRDSIHSLEQKLSRAEAHANGLENEGHHAALAAAEKGALLEAVARERDQAHTRLKEVEAELQSERDRASRAGARQEAMQERLAQAQSEGALLRQQLEEAHSRGMAKEQAASDAQERFTEVLNQLRADGEERVQLVEERSKELAAKNAELREQNYRLEQEKAERESSLRQLQQELADSLKKLSMCEASLEVNTRYRSDLEEEKARTQKDMDRLKGKLQESEELYIQAERRVNNLKGSLDDKERDVINIGQKLQEALAGTANTDQTIKQLEEAMQRLEIENARLEAAAKQQTSRIEVLQKEAQEATVPSDSSPGGRVRHRFEDLVTNLQSSKMTLEDQLSREMQKQNVLSHNAHDSQALWEEELKSRSRIGLRLAELEKQKGELSNQVELEKKKTKKMAEQKKAVDTRLEQEMKRNTELQKEMYRLRTLVKTAKKKLREQAGGELDSPVGSLRVELGHRHSEAEGAITRMKAKVDDLQGQLEREALRCFRQEEVNRELKEQLGALRSLGRSHEQLERSKRQLENEVVALRRQAEAGVMDQSQAEQYRREMEERARQEIRHKLEEVNIFLQTQAASQEALEQMKAANEASQRVHLEQRIRELEGDLSRVRTAQHDSLVQRDSSRTELERYQELYTEELKLRKSLSAKLERSNERLAETNAKLLSERQRSKSILSSGLMNGSLGGLEGASLGSVGAYGSSLGPLNRNLGTSLLGSVGEPQGNHVEAYLAKMQSELEKNISKELDYATTELEGGSARMSPVGSACASQKNLNLNLEQQDPLSKATQQYLEVLKKNYMI